MTVTAGCLVPLVISRPARVPGGKETTVFKNKSDADIERDLKNKELIEVKNG
ncbi:hypothetical protein [Dickeya dianthicola]|uniref:hypothetical protein n=1 Tax=Dickeya dianthicola TaxID=204039 RepID=UPI0018685B0D|nr:hypothetical protein [Dickeya dianthicola]QOL14092.1 hypothetical protein HGI48_07605 [Dickeya dianthicola]